MTDTVPAAATGLPAFHSSAWPPMPRRGFLAGLATLPLIGGSVALIGRPRAVAVAATPDLLEAYKTWLEYERRALSWEMAADPLWQHRYRNFAPADDRDTLSHEIDQSFVFIGQSNSFSRKNGSPSTRAALVMSTVGCDWRDDADDPAQRRA